MIFNLELGLIEIIAMIGAGFYLLTIAADWLVNGAANLAKRIGVSSLVIGLTVVAFGTSMPELVVSVDASLAGNPGILKRQRPRRNKEVPERCAPVLPELRAPDTDHCYVSHFCITIFPLCLAYSA